MNNVPLCPPAERLQAFLDGRLSKADADVVADHLTDCPVCVTRVPELTTTDSLIEMVRAPDPLSQSCHGAEVERLVRHLSDLRIPSEEPETDPTIGVALKTPIPRGELTGELPLFLGPPSHEGDLGQLGSYRLLDILAAGGMGVVFRAIDPQLGRQVAIKTLRQELAKSEQGRKRFLREARAIATLRHDNIVPIYQVGEQKGVPYLVMPLLEGHTLEAHLREHGAMDLQVLRRLAVELAEGLAAAHACGLVHRDIKPDNVWVETTPSGLRIKLLDFGLARPLEERESITRIGAVIGTPAFMAPELFRGEEADARSDLFSLGCVLYRMATGQMPFKDRRVPTRHEIRLPRSLRNDLPADLETLILSLLNEDPEKRLPSAHAVIVALRGGESALTGTGGKPKKIIRVALFLIVCLALAGLVWRMQAPQEEQPGTSPPPLAQQPFDKVSVPEEKRFPWHPPELLTLLGETRLRGWGVASAVTISPDARLLASCCTSQRSLQLWDTRGQLKWERRLDSEPYALAFSSDGRLLAVGKKAGAWIFEVSGFALTERCRLDAIGAVPTLSFAPASDVLAVTTDSASAYLSLWNVSSSKPQRLASWSGGRLADRVAFSPDGKRLVVGCENGGVQLLEIQGDTIVSRMNIPCPDTLSPTRRVVGVGFARDGANVLAAWNFGLVQLWDASSDTPKLLRSLPTEDFLVGMIVLPDGRHVALAGRVSLRLVDLTEERVELRAFLPMRTFPLRSIGCSSDGRTLITSSMEHGIRFYRFAKKKLTEEAMPVGPAFGVRFLELSVDGSLLAVAGRDSTIHLWNLRGPEPIAEPILDVGREVQGLSLSPDGKTLVVFLSSDVVESWNLSATPPVPIASRKMSGQQGLFAARPDGGSFLIACQGRDQKQVLRDWSEQRTVARLDPVIDHPVADTILSMAIKRDGTLLATGHDEGVLRLWDAHALSAKDPLRMILPRRVAITGLTFVDRGKKLIVLQRDRPASLVDCSETPPREMVTLREEGQTITLAVAPDEKTLATSTSLGGVSLWRMGELLASKETKARTNFAPYHGWQFPGPVQQLRFHPDGKHLLTGHADGTVGVLRLPQ